MTGQTGSTAAALARSTAAAAMVRDCGVGWRSGGSVGRRRAASGRRHSAAVAKQRRRWWRHRLWRRGEVGTRRAPAAAYKGGGAAACLGKGPARGGVRLGLPSTSVRGTTVGKAAARGSGPAGLLAPLGEGGIFFKRKYSA